MKKLIFSALALGLVFMACEKDEITSKKTADAFVESDEPINTRQNGYPQYYELPGPVGQDGDPDYGCSGIGGNCYGLVAPLVPHLPAIGGVIDVVNEGEPAPITDAFLMYEGILDIYVDPSVVDGVIAGMYTVKNTGEFSSGSIAYLQFYDAEEELVGVYRLTH